MLNLPSKNAESLKSKRRYFWVSLPNKSKSFSHLKRDLFSTDHVLPSQKDCLAIPKEVLCQPGMIVKPPQKKCSASTEKCLATWEGLLAILNWVFCFKEGPFSCLRRNVSHSKMSFSLCRSCWAHLKGDLIIPEQMFSLPEVLLRLSVHLVFNQLQKEDSVIPTGGCVWLKNSSLVPPPKDCTVTPEGL